MTCTNPDPELQNLPRPTKVQNVRYESEVGYAVKLHLNFRD